MYSTFNEGKSIVVEKSNRTFKSKIHKYLTSVSKNGYIDELDDIVHEYNHTYHDAIKMKATCKLKHIYWTQCRKYDEDPKFNTGNHAKISK